METQKIDYQLALLECQQAYRKAAVYETFLELNLDKILRVPLVAEMAAEQLGLHTDAFSRFLHAAAYLGLVEKKQDKFQSIRNFPSYSKESSLVLFRLFEHINSDVKLSGQINNSVSNIEEALLESAVKFNLLIKKGDKNYFLPNSTKKYFLCDSLDYIGHRIKHFEKIMFPMFSMRGLMGALKTGKSQWEFFVQEGVSHPFILYKTNPKLLEIFTNGMHQLNTEDDGILARSLDLKNVRTILDVGGGSGAFALQLLNCSSSIKQIDIYELPEAIPLMKKVFHRYAPNETRLRFVPGSFLEDTKNGNLVGLRKAKKYDLIVLGWILHDWSDRTNVEILRKISTHLNLNKNLVILEYILPENKVGIACQADLAMLLQTEGRERTYLEYCDLLHLSGFNNISILKTKTSRQAIVASKVR